MLKKIQIENFKSFKNETTIDFNSTNYKILRNTNVNKDGILKGGIFVGGNATGKTNVILALKLLLDLLFRDRIINIAQYRCLFSEEDTIKLDYEFFIEKKDVKYSIEYNTFKQTISENLYVDNKNMLNRIGKSAKSKITDNTIYDDLDNKTLLLRTIYFNTKFTNYPVLKKWFDYLGNSIYIDASLRARYEVLEGYTTLKEYFDEKGETEINNFFN